MGVRTPTELIDIVLQTSRSAVCTALAAVAALTILVGAGLWGWRLVERDPSEVPVIRALSGPMKMRPEAGAFGVGSAARHLSAASGKRSDRAARTACSAVGLRVVAGGEVGRNDAPQKLVDFIHLIC